MTIENISNITTFGDLLTFVNAQTYDFFGVGILFLVFTILFANYYRQYKISVSLFISLVTLLPVVTILFLLNLVSIDVVILFVLIMGISGLYLYIKRNEY